ncbi:MAG: hypothetical protein IKF72_03245 [Kiritimatiellae bacterium]|nr:hypothetical protein [Kiritimatiellia bacterium]
MANFLRLLTGIALLPACWGFMRALFDAIVASAGAEGMSPEALSLLGGIAAFALAWMALSHPVKAYVLGHELTHALWGLLFGARPSDLRVGEGGGSVRLTKSNILITLAPYFFPFYTFVVIVCALVTFAFLRPLPCLPLWMFLIGFTWAFHVLFTLETLGQRQPDVKLYGRIFSWTFIFLVNVMIVLVWLASATPVTFASVGGFIVGRVCSAYSAVWAFAWSGGRWIVSLCTRTS